MNKTTDLNREIRLGMVCAFMEEQPSHSKYNIKKLVKSLSRIENMQMLCIANGCRVSDDLRNFLNDQPRNTFREEPMNIGVPAAWNLGIDLLEFDYLFVLNDDIKIDEKCINELVGVFESLPDTAVAGVEGVCSDTVDESGFPASRTKYKKKRSLFQKPAILIKKEIIDVSNVSGFLFAISGDFIRKTSFRFDTNYSPAFCEELDLAFFARNNGYRTRIVTGLENNYDHSWGVSSGPKEIKYLDKTIMSNELSKRNMTYFVKKWGDKMEGLLRP